MNEKIEKIGILSIPFILVLFWGTLAALLTWENFLIAMGVIMIIVLIAFNYSQVHIKREY